MDAAGKNRYELLFMDDDGEIPSVKEVVNKKKQQTPATTPAAAGTAAAVATKKPASNKKSTAEKENKAAALNKNDAGNKKATTTEGKEGPKSRQGAANANTNATGGNRPRYNNDNNRSVTFRTQNNEVRGERDQRDQREQRNNRRNFRDNNNAGADGGNEQRPPRQYNRERDNRGPPRKREFDRQSGSDKTGVKAVDKRDGAGAHNWGSVKQEIEDINKANTGEAEATLTDKEDSANDQSTDQVPANEEEEAKEMTLDEYKALKQQRAKPQYNLRKAGEGEDSSQWKKGFVLNKKKEGESEEELEYDPSMYPQRVGRLQRIVDIPFKFNDERRGGFGGRNRGRGGPRPGGNQENRGDNRENRGRFEEGGRSNFNRAPRNFGERQSRNAASHVPKVDDERQFPTLG